MTPLRSLAATVSLALLFTLVGCAGDPPEVPAGPDGAPDAQLVLGRDIYANRCASCHGASGTGGRGPALHQGRMVSAYPDVDDHVAVVRDGRGSGMPAFGEVLTDEEIDAVVAYNRSVL